MSNSKEMQIHNYNQGLLYPYFIRLNAKTMTFDTLTEVITSCRNTPFYHKFKVSECKMNDRHSVMSHILKFVNPVEITPVAYKQIGRTECEFFVKDCLDLLMKIIANKFIIPTDEPNHCLIFDIWTNACPSSNFKIDHAKDLITNLKSRLDVHTKKLNLAKFLIDDKLESYYPLYQPKTMLHVMSFAASFSPNSIILQHNNLRDINSIYPLNKNDLTLLDLRNNKISCIDDLECLKHFKNLKHLLLAENPICATYHSYSYVIDIKNLCKSLKTLDSIDVSGTPQFQKNFLCNEEAGDLASGFIEHFFTLYDSNDRSALVDLYDNNALLSVTSSNITSQTSDTVNLAPYGQEEPFLVCGRNDLMKLFHELPVTNHDPYSFTCDVLSCTTNYATICLKGIFRERNQILHFSRNFILKRLQNEFVIINDQLFVCYPTDCHIKWSFRFPKPNDLYPYFTDQYKDIENALRMITHMNSGYCERFLDMCGYDLKKSIENFIEIYKENSIPKEAFHPERWSSRNYSCNNTFSEAIIARTRTVSNKMNAKTIWEIYNKYRFAHTRDTKPYKKDSSIYRIYTRRLKSAKKSDQPRTPPSKKRIIKINLPSLNTIKSSVNKNVSNAAIYSQTTPQFQKSSNQKQKVTSSPPSPLKISQTADIITKSRETKWHQKAIKPSKTSAFSTRKISSKPKIVEIATRVARKLRRKKLKKQQKLQENLSSMSKQSSITPATSKSVTASVFKPIVLHTPKPTVSHVEQSATVISSQVYISRPPVPAVQVPVQNCMPINLWFSNMIGANNYLLNTLPESTYGMPNVMSVPQINPEIPIPPADQLCSNNFNPDEFEPPDFNSDHRDNETPPPGVDIEEYLEEYEGKSTQKRKSDQVSEMESKKHKSSTETSVSHLGHVEFKIKQ